MKEALMNWELVVAYTWPFWILMGLFTWMGIAVMLFQGIPTWPRCTALVGALGFGMWADKSSDFYDWTVAVRQRPRP